MSKWSRWLVLLVALAAGLVAPARIAGRHARALYDDDQAQQLALSRGVAAWVSGKVDTSRFHTGHDFFDHEWVFGTYMMAVMGLGQVSHNYPDTIPSHAPIMEACLDALTSERVRDFDAGIWGADPLTSLEGPDGHVAYLGYMNLSLGMLRTVKPQTRYAALHDRITAALTRRYEHSEIGLLETYPGQYYPVDNLAAIGSLALHADATGQPRPPLVAKLIARMRKDYVDPRTGLLIQAISPRGNPADQARGSGTALGAYFASWADRPFASELHAALTRHLARAPLGFGMVREYTNDRGWGDIDSGPLIAGMSISATGFSLASARIAGDAEHFERVYRTAHLFGAPHTANGRTSYAGGGPLGNALMLAMLTAPRGLTP